MTDMNSKTIITLLLLIFSLPVASSLLSYISVSVMSTYISQMVEVERFQDAMSWSFVVTCIVIVLLAVVTAFLLGLRPIPDELTWSKKRMLFSVIFVFVGSMSVMLSVLLGVSIEGKFEIISFSNKMGRNPFELFLFMAIFNVGVVYTAVWKLWVLGKIEPNLGK